MSKRISVQWRITILTALLIAAACVSLNLLLFYSGSDRCAERLCGGVQNGKPAGNDD